MARLHCSLDAGKERKQGRKRRELALAGFAAMSALCHRVRAGKRRDRNLVEARIRFLLRMMMPHLANFRAGNGIEPDRCRQRQSTKQKNQIRVQGSSPETYRKLKPTA